MPLPDEMEDVTACPLCGAADTRVWREAACPENSAEVFTIVECTTCGLRYVNPRPRPEALGRYYADDYYSYQYAPAPSWRHVLKCRAWRAFGLLPARGSAWQLALRRALMSVWGPRIAVLLPVPRPGLRFLDVGCGAGFRLGLALELGWETYGVDVGHSGLLLAREAGHAVAVADGVRLPLADDSFDYVNLVHTLEHTRDPVATLAEIRRVMTPGGLVQIMVPNGLAWGLRRYGDHWRALDVPRHLYHFTPDSLRATVERAGLRIVASQTRCVPWVLEQSALLAGEAPAPIPGRLGRWLLEQRGLGEDLNVWCERQPDRAPDAGPGG